MELPQEKTRQFYVWYNDDMQGHLPPTVRACLWSYDTDKLDLSRDKQLVIVQVLNHGGIDAVKWLRQTYTTTELVDAVSRSARSEWSPKSLTYWGDVLGTAPERSSRFA